MKVRVAIAAALAAGVVISTPAWAIQEDGEESTTTVEVTEAPSTATDAPTDPPTTTEAPPSTNANSTTTITIPTTLAEPTTTETAAQPNTDGQTTLSPPTGTTTRTPTTPEPEQSESPSPPPTEEEGIALVVALLSFYEAEPLVESVTTTTLPSNKVFVCKYTGTPGIDEVLQTGQNPISVAYQPGREPGNYFNDAQGRSYSLAWDIGQPEPNPNQCPPPNTGTTTTSSSTTTSSTSTTTSSTSTSTSTTSTTLVPTTTSSTTTTVAPTTTTSSTTTTTEPGTTTTTIVRGSLLGIDDFAFCDEETNTPMISITFGSRPDLDGDPGLLTFSDGTEYSGNPLTFQSGQTIVFPYPASLTTPLTLTYSIFGETATAVVTLPEDCPPSTTTTTEVTSSTTTTLPIGSTTTTSSPSTTTTSSPGTTTTSTSTTPSTTTSSTAPPTFAFGAAATVCVAEVPTIRINFLNTFPELAGQTGTLTMSDINGNVVSTQALVYQPGTTVDLLYPGTSVNADGSIDDVPGWILTDDGFWIRDPSDEFLRDGINLSYTVNPTATAFVTYPPESSTCANPDGPFPPSPGAPPAPPGGVLPPSL